MLTPFTASANLSVFACEPEWQALAKEIGGDKISTFSATTAKQNPHYIEARPSLIAKLRRVDLLICSGAGLEAGWLPILLRRSRNRNVQPGTPGYLMAADHVTLLEIPARLDRSEGDIHAEGNPHLHLAPDNIHRIARVLLERIMRLDPDNADFYRSNGDSFLERWAKATATWKKKAAPLEGKSVVVHHRKWIYLLDWLGMKRLAALEPKPGLPPTAGHLSTLTELLDDRPVLAIIRSPMNDSRPSTWLAGKTGVPAIVLPYTVGGMSGVSDDLFALFEDTIRRLTEPVQ